MSDRLEFVRSMIDNAWSGYHKFAMQQQRRLYTEVPKGWFGRDPVCNVLCSMGTLLLANYKDEFDQAEKWVMKNLDLSLLRGESMVFELVSGYLSSLLSLHALTLNKWYLDKAVELATLLKPAYESPSGLPFWKLDLQTKIISKNCHIVTLSECYNGALEYNYLSDITSIPEFRERTAKIRKLLKEKEKPRGCYMSRIDAQTGAIWGTKGSLLKETREWFYTLIKEWYQSDGRDQEALEMYYQGVDKAVEHKGFQIITSRTGRMYVQVFDPYTKKDDRTMDYDGCNVPAMLALGAQAMIKSVNHSPDESDEHYWTDVDRGCFHWKLAEDIQKTCNYAHEYTCTKLAPKKFYFSETMDASNNYWGPYDKQYHLGYEMAESYFVMWRLTGDYRYREDAWQLAQSIHKHCFTKGGYSSIKRVDEKPTVMLKIMTPHFLGGTLKYLYLTFADDQLYGLDQWLFSSTGQLLPIKGRNKAYPAN